MANELSKEERSEFAVPLWDLLIGMAKNGSQSKGKTYEDAIKTYGRVSHLLKEKAPEWGLLHWQMGSVLDPIQEYCESKGLPRLTGLAINAETRKPTFAVESKSGYGYKGDPEKWEEEAQEVCDYPWDEKHPDNPGYEEFFQHARSMG